MMSVHEKRGCPKAPSPYGGVFAHSQMNPGRFGGCLASNHPWRTRRYSAPPCVSQQPTDARDRTPDPITMIWYSGRASDPLQTRKKQRSCSMILAALNPQSCGLLLVWLVRASNTLLDMRLVPFVRRFVVLTRDSHHGLKGSPHEEVGRCRLEPADDVGT